MTASISATSSNRQALLSVRDLSIAFHTPRGISIAVEGLNLDVFRGKTLGIVGESGCGKSISSLAVMGLLPKPNGFIQQGEIRFEEHMLTQFSERQYRHIRGNDIAMIFQEPMTALNPVYTAGNQVREAILLHQSISRREAKAQAIEMLNKVGIPSPAQRYESYPHELSGGMRQRVMIAMALSCEPKLLIADEPTTALDVTIQAQIMDLLKELQEERDMGMILITHDMGVVAQHADDILVMYAGKPAEQAPTQTLFRNAAHPYTYGLMQSIPGFAPLVETPKGMRLPTIDGTVPSIDNMPAGCRFEARCLNAQAICSSEQPSFTQLPSDKTHLMACHHPMHAAHS